MGVRPQTHLGGHQIFARKVCHSDDISKKKKKTKKKKVIACFAAPFPSLLAKICHQTCVQTGVNLFFFFGDAIAVTNFSAKM